MRPNIPIKEIMTTDLTTVKKTATSEEIQKIFEKNSFHHLPVVDSAGRLEGIISREDFFRIAYLLNQNLDQKDEATVLFSQTEAMDLMTPQPLSLDPEDTVGLAADIFLANEFHALPIIEDDTLVGLITTHDLLAYGYNSPVEEGQS
jgi:CBS domain-containing protein